MWKISHIRDVLMCLSNGEEELSDGAMFTSSSHGFNCSSSKISKPISSKQVDRFPPSRSSKEVTVDSTESSVLMTSS